MGCSNDKLIKVKAIQNSELEKSKILPIKPNSEKEPKIKRNIDTKERLDLMTAEDMSKIDINDKKKDEIGEIDIIKKDKNKKDINLNKIEKQAKEEKIKENQIEENNILIIEEVDENNVIIEEREEKNEKIQNIQENFEKYSENDNKNSKKEYNDINDMENNIEESNKNIIINIYDIEEEDLIVEDKEKKNPNPNIDKNDLKGDNNKEIIKKKL